MKGLDNLVVKVDCKVEVSDQTAEHCLKLLEIWQDNNPDKYIEVQRIVAEAGTKTVKTIFAIGGGETTHEQM